MLIDDHPEEPVDQYLVAGHVGLNPSATALMARSTTMMPNKLGKPTISFKIPPLEGNHLKVS